MSKLRCGIKPGLMRRDIAASGGRYDAEFAATRDAVFYRPKRTQCGQSIPTHSGLVIALREQIPTDSTDSLVAAVAEANNAILSHLILTLRPSQVATGSERAALLD